MQYYKSEELFRWDLKFVDCSTHEIHEIKCPTKLNDYTVYTKVNTTVTDMLFLYQIEHPDLAAQIDAFVEKLEALKSCDTPFHLVSTGPVTLV